MNSTIENIIKTTPPDVPFSDLSFSPCHWILFAKIGFSSIRFWDLMILMPNGLFLAFLICQFRDNISKLRLANSPIFLAFYGLVFVVSIISVLRCVVSMTVDASVIPGDIVDKMLWLILRFFLLGTEVSVLIFGVYFGHLDSKTSIKRVLLCTSFFALSYSSVQGTLELTNQHELFTGSTQQPDNSTENYDLFAHGGMVFLSASSFFFGLAYCIVLILPLTRVKERFILPVKRSFYYYVGLLATLNVVQATSSLLFYNRLYNALCVVDFTTYLYFTIFYPLVYRIFLWKFFRSMPNAITFSYTHQIDDVSDDQVSLPYQIPYSATTGHTSSTDTFSVESTHFNCQADGAGVALSPVT